MKRFKKKLSATIFLLLLPVCHVFTFDSSPAGGGWLEVSGPEGYAFVADHEDFGKNLESEFTLEMWIYMERVLEFGEVWILLHKEGSYLLTLSGHGLGPDGLLPIGERSVRIAFYYNGNDKGGVGRSSGRSHDGDDGMPLNQWHHIAFVHDENGYQLYINGKQTDIHLHKDGHLLGHSNFSLYIGGTGTNPGRFQHVKLWTQFTGGLIDEVRISKKARYPVKNEEWVKIAVPQGRFEPDEDTVALWHFGVSRDQWLEDASGRGHTLTAVDLHYNDVEVSRRLPAIWGQIKRD